MNTLAFTGHRPERLKGQEGYIRAQLTYWFWAHPMFTKVYIGGARGADLICGEVALKEGRKVEVVLPFGVDSFTSRWFDPTDKDRLLDIISHSNSKLTQLAKDRHSNQDYIIRDKYMVDRAELVLGVWDGDRGGGTWATLNHGIKTKKPIHVIWPEPIDFCIGQIIVGGKSRAVAQSLEGQCWLDGP